MDAKKQLKSKGKKKGKKNEKTGKEVAKKFFFLNGNLNQKIKMSAKLKIYIINC
jgi:hypothetical protein